jgi:hypothetical protein
MAWYLIGLNAQLDPVPVILLFALACLALWFFSAQARRRDARRASKDRDLSGWRSRQRY